MYFFFLWKISAKELKQGDTVRVFDGKDNYAPLLLIFKGKNISSEVDGYLDNISQLIQVVVSSGPFFYIDSKFMKGSHAIVSFIFHSGKISTSIVNFQLCH